MHIRFVAAADPAIRLRARLVAADALPADLAPALAEGAKASRFAGKEGQLFEGFVAEGAGVLRVALVGLGKDADRAAYEQAGGALAAKYATSGETVLSLDASGLAGEDVAAVLLGLKLRAWRWDAYRTKLTAEQKPSLAEIVVVGAAEGTEKLWAQAAALAEGVEFTRELVTEPANVIYPESFVERVKMRFASTGAEISVLGEDEMRGLGMGALLGVAQGSVRKPQLLVIRWNGGEADAAPIAFVGKGVTFDTGGICLKPAAGMEDMKWDMGGAGAVAGAMLSLARRKVRANVVGICGLVENMPDANAQRPGDVVTSMNGQTIEVINTDAEGRLVLCDALTYAQRTFKPACVVDLATLTGAIIASLAHEYAGLFSTNDQLAADLAAAGEATGDKLWRMPMGKVYDKMIDSPIADMKNVGGKWGGSITAAQFLARYIENDTPWAHLDIAGTVWTDKPGATFDKGATGYGVRLLNRFVDAAIGA